MLFNEPKLLKSARILLPARSGRGFSALQRAEIAEIRAGFVRTGLPAAVSVLFNEPKLLKFRQAHFPRNCRPGFSALQRAEIAEIGRLLP